jgi:hypothetical protein
MRSTVADENQSEDGETKKSIKRMRDTDQEMQRVGREGERQRFVIVSHIDIL